VSCSLVSVQMEVEGNESVQVTSIRVVQPDNLLWSIVVVDLMHNNLRGLYINFLPSPLWVFSSEDHMEWCFYSNARLGGASDFK
jgi:hypothetical protein